MTGDKKVVLKTLAESVAKPGLKFLEVGSWLADSTILLGKVALQHSGHLFCVDWWKGNVGTELETIATQHDIFSIFWKKICAEGLDDVVIPIRGKSEVAVEIFKPETFDLVFIDGDHRYDHVLKDIQKYAPLVKREGGILCGDDCEGYISEYDEDFLNVGRDMDYHETVHCGVVLAVGETFKQYSNKCNIWSTVRKQQDFNWGSAQHILGELPAKAQESPPFFASSQGYYIFRYRKNIYAVPKALPPIDLTLNHSKLPTEVIRGTNMNDVEQQIGEPIEPIKEYPMLLATYENYNIVSFNNRILAIDHALGPMDLTKATSSTLEEYRSSERIIYSDNLEEAKNSIDFSTPRLVREEYKGFNIIFFRGKYYAVSLESGAIYDWHNYDFHPLLGAGKCFIVDSQKDAEIIIGLIYSYENKI
jgi:Methyltransferase domain